MKRHVLALVALSASLLTAGYVLGQNKAAPAPAAAKPQKSVRVATLKSVDANREFQANVQLMQAQRLAVQELTKAMETEKDSKKKAEMKADIEKRVAKLNDDNQKMQKAYGFSLSRSYTMEIEVSHIYMLVSDEEAAQLEKAEKEQNKKK
jgi:hypothetical protein